jgi:hypothetical protein
VQRGLATGEMLDAWRVATQADANRELDRARAAPWPDVSTLFERI